MSEKPYICTTCGKSYRNAKSLKSHAVHCDSQNEIVKEMRSQLNDLTQQVAILKEIIMQISDDAGSHVKKHTQRAHRAPKAQAELQHHNINAFGHENYSHLICNPNSGFIVDTIKGNESLMDCLRIVIRKLYRDEEHKENNTVVYTNGVYHIFNGTIWKPIENKTKLVRKVKQRANNVLQHFLTSDTDAFTKAIGEERFTQLDEFTYKIDTCDDHPEFEKETDDLVNEELINNYVEPHIPIAST